MFHLRLLSPCMFLFAEMSVMSVHGEAEAEAEAALLLLESHQVSEEKSG